VFDFILRTLELGTCGPPADAVLSRAFIVPLMPEIGKRLNRIARRPAL